MKNSNEYQREYRLTHREEQKKYVKKYQETHRGSIKIRDKKWKAAHPGCARKSTEKWRKANPEKWKETRKTSSLRWNRKHPEYAKTNHTRFMAKHPRYNKEYRQTLNGKTSIRRTSARRRQFGFIPLNQPFKGSCGHHINAERVLYIPAEMHEYNRHSVTKDRNMDTINNLAFNWLEAEALDKSMEYRVS